jgi:hypothetical protein
MILNTLSKDGLRPETVICACDRLVSGMDSERYLNEMAVLGIDETLGRSYLAEARRMFSGEALRYRLKTELGESYGSAVTYAPMSEARTVTEKICPLGVLFHIAAGNADALPAFSVLEGLLTGNINILKLPAAEGGISVRLLSELIKIEPSLSEYIYVFDYSSKDITHIEKLVSVSDAVVVWGGDEAVSAVRRLSKPNIKIIEWGHKISFAYLTKKGMTAEKLEGLAQNIARTGQLLCSSCQGIFLNTEDPDEVYAFCGSFLPVLERACAESPYNNIRIRAQTALELYCAELEGIYGGKKVFRGENCGLIAYADSLLVPAVKFGNAWVKPLKRENLLSVLRPYKNHLQTVGLLCGEDEREELARTLFKTGVVRVCPGEKMSETYPGAPHDGEYPLSRYVKIVSEEI